MLLAVADLIEQERLVTNHINLDDSLKTAFTRHFSTFQSGRDQNTPYNPFYYLKSDGFWHHCVKQGQEAAYEQLRRSCTPGRVAESIAFSFLDEELFEYLRSDDARDQLRHALRGSLDEERQQRFLHQQVDSAWSWFECDAIVDDYLDMLVSELSGKPYVKAEHNRQLQEKLTGRTRGSIERKHMNISAVMHALGLPSIDGYKPYHNFQRRILPDVVGAKVRGHNKLQKILNQDGVSNALSAYQEPTNILQCLVPNPTTVDVGFIGSSLESEGAKHYRARKVDYLAQNTRNQQLGLKGEEFVIRFEIARLLLAGKDSLADRIEQVSLEDDSLGYDIRSFEENGSDRFIEVKTTTYGSTTPFFVSQNELSTSNTLNESYHLYRVFKYGANTKLFQRSGPLQEQFAVSPYTYRAEI